MATFRIATFVNDERLYAGMRKSFEAAGFVDPVARYTIEGGEPYHGITRLGTSAEPYVVLVHQDVLCDQGHTAEDLSRRLEELTRVDSMWAVAGNAGGTRQHLTVQHLASGGIDWRTSGLPQRVTTLDENMLILRTSAKPHCSPDLSGFHLYGADVCLHAARDGRTAYVTDFLVTHLSAGNMDGFDPAARQFAKAWARRWLRPRYVHTTCGTFPVARTAPVRRAMTWPPLSGRLAPGLLDPTCAREDRKSEGS